MSKKRFHSITDLHADPENARLHNSRNIGMIERSLQEVGAARSIVIDENGVILAGNGLVEAAVQAGIHQLRVIEASGDEIIAVQRSNLTDDQKTLLALYDNRTSELSEWKPTVLATIAERLNMSNLFLPTELTEKLSQAATELIDTYNLTGDLIEANIESIDDVDTVETLPITVLNVPDILFPSDNDWGVPTLDIRMQAQYVVAPVERWGRIARHGSTMPGTWHFYTEDYKFNSLWDKPNVLQETGCVNAVEPNISTNTQMPAAVALWGIYRKRWIARLWQSQGIRIFVDLNVDSAFADLNLLGVPVGWTSYATRAYDNNTAMLTCDHKRAITHAQTDAILFLVFGGGKAIQQYCKERGWHWIPQENHVIEGRQQVYGQG